jgi:hypothetical protein
MASASSCTGESTLLLAFAAGVTILTALLCGLAPALTAARTSIGNTLRQSGPVTRVGGASRLSMRGVTVAVEVALALVLLTGGSLMLATLARLRGDPLGIDPRNVVTFSIRPPEARYATASAPAFIERLLAEMHTVPGITAATVDGRPAHDLVRTARSTIVGRPITLPGALHPTTLCIASTSACWASQCSEDAHSRILIATDDRRGHHQRGSRASLAEPESDRARIWFGGSRSDWSFPDSSLEVIGVVGDVPYQEGDDRRIIPAVYTPYLQFTYSTAR